jgi:hypothetical protein
MYVPHLYARGWFEKFVNSPYYSESELCGGAVTVSFSKYSVAKFQPQHRWSLRNFLPRSSLFMVGKAQKSHEARSELNSVFSLEKTDRWNPIRTSAIQSRSRSIRFLGFSNHERGASRQDILKRSAVCSTFSRSGWNVVRSVLLSKKRTSEKRPSPHLHKFPTRINKVSPQTFQTALVYIITKTFKKALWEDRTRETVVTLTPKSLTDNLRIYSSRHSKSGLCGVSSRTRVDPHSIRTLRVGILKPRLWVK